MALINEVRLAVVFFPLEKRFLISSLYQAYKFHH